MSEDSASDVNEVNIQINKHCDIGNLMFADSNSFLLMKEEEIDQSTLENVNLFMQQLHKLKEQQKETEGLVLEGSVNMIQLPEGAITLPRAMPIPKPKPQTKWEKFRIEKGLNARKKRGRMVYDEITKDWVPRHGAGSIKAIEKKHDWLIEGDFRGKEDPFIAKNAERKLNLEKEKLKQVNNQMKAKQLSNQAFGKEKQVEDSKIQRENNKNRRNGKIQRKDKEILNETLRIVQKSTASRGVFDNKINGEEPELKKKIKQKRKEVARA